MSERGFLVYKCRMCGGLDKSTHVPDGASAALAIVVGIKSIQNWGHSMVQTHRCKDGNIGVTDFIGVELDE